MPCELCGGSGSTPIHFSREDCQYIHDQGAEMLKAGLQIPIPLEHRMNLDADARLASSVSHNAGFVTGYQLAEDGSLWGELDIGFLPDPTGGPGWSDPEHITQRLESSIKYVSPSIVPGFRDGQGRQWDGIVHVALTPIPVWHTQAPFGTPLPPRDPCTGAQLSRGNWRTGAIQLSLPAQWVDLDLGRTYMDARRASSGGGTWYGPYFGPRGGTYWESGTTGRRVYQEKKPGSYQHEGPDEEDKTPEPKPEDIAAPNIVHEALVEPPTSEQEKPDEPVAADGGGSDRERLPAGEQLGAEPEEAPRKAVSRTRKGTGKRSRKLPASADARRDGSGDETGGRGDAAADGAGTGDAEALPDAGGRDSADGAVGDGRAERSLERGGDASADGGEGPAPRSPSAESLNEEPTPENPTDLAAGNWRYHDRDFFKGGLKTKFRANLEALKTLQAIRLEGRDAATPAEQEVMSRFVGWGQFPGVFNLGGYGHEQELIKAGVYANYEEARQDRDQWEKEREELQRILTDEEWDAARAATLNSHFTHPAIVDAHWKMAQRLGFKGGKFLETSAGIGYYLGLMPPDMAARTHSTAIELDHSTGKMLDLLYPAANVQVQGFQDHKSPPGFYDLVASNVPFGDYKVHDPDYNKHKANIHDYFFLKSADQVRAGGLIMHITSTGTLDKGDSSIREALQAKGLELVGAIRFPGAAHKANAGTDVVTDMLVFRKRMPGEAPGDTSWTQTVEIPDPDGGEPLRVNKYFADHPEQILGRLDRTGTMYGGAQQNVSLISPEELSQALGREVKIKVDPETKKPKYVYADSGEGVPGSVIAEHGQPLFEKRLAAAIERMPQNVMTSTRAPAERYSPEVLPAPGDVKDGGYHLKDGKLYVSENGVSVPHKVPAATQKRIEAQLGIRDAVREIIRLETSGQNADKARGELNQRYDAYVEEHGFLHEKANRQALRTDPDHPVLLALENWNGDTKKATKASIFEKETIRHVPKVDKAGSVHEGLGVSLHENGHVDVEHIAKLTGHNKERVEHELRSSGLAFEDPSHGWQPADQYLSGNVRRKLAMAKAAAATDPRYKVNVAALEKVQPADVDYGAIKVRLGVPWVPPEDVAAFAAHLVEGQPDNFKIGYVPGTGEWHADFAGTRSDYVRRNRAAKKWSTKEYEVHQLLASALNGRQLIVRRPDPTDPEGKRTIVDEEATRDAAAKAQEIKDEFEKWIWTDDDRRHRLHRYYNDNFNNIRHIRYNGQHLTFPGMNTGVKLHPHIKDFAWRIISTGKGLAAHEVGTGKTYAMIASAMELRRLGLARKPAIACLKANIEQITRDAIHLYPGAKVISTADMFDAQKRKQTISRIATGDYDLIILTHDHMNMLRMKPEVQQKYINEELAELEAAKSAREAELGKQAKGDKVVKAMEKAKKNLEAKLKAALDDTKKDNAVFFEDTGIDHLFVDEAHHFKALPVYTKQGMVKGIPTSRSNRATNMQMRVRWLMEHHGGRGVTFATGTPVTNTMAELYNMQRYLQPEELKERGIDNFDAWSKTFGDLQTKMEFTATGEYKPVTRFSKFSNIPELMQITRQVMDVQRADDLKHPDGSAVIQRPKRADEAVISPNNEAQMELMADMKSRAKTIKLLGKPEKGMDNMLSVCTDGRKGAVDMRLLNPEAADDPDSKTNQCVRKVLELHAANPGYAQVIFSDLGVHDMEKSKRARVSSGKSALDDDEVRIEADDDSQDSGEASGEDAAEANAQKQMMAGSDKFNLYQDIIGKLVAGGIPREKIADFSQLAGAKKDEACAAMRRGDIVVALGSTKKLGTGTNVQDRLMAMHHLDVPWVPADVEQRDGRGWRHGNILAKEGRPIGVHRYVAEGSLDQMFWQIIGNKAGFIKQALSGDIESMPREMKEESGEELTPEQLMAAASGDPRVLEKIQLEDDVKNLKFAEDRHRREQDRARDAAANAKRQLDQVQGHIAGLSQDIVELEGHKDFYLTLDGETHTEREKATEALSAKVKEIETRWGEMPSWQRYRIEDEQIGEYRGFKLYRSFEKDAPFKLEGPSGLKYPTGDTLRSIENVARGLTHAKEKLEGQAKLLEADLKRPVTQGVPFPKGEELEEKRKRIKELEAALAPKKEEAPAQEADEPSDDTLPPTNTGNQGRKHHAEVDEAKVSERPAIPDVGHGTYDLDDIKAIGQSLGEHPARIASQPNEEGYSEVLDGVQVGPFVIAHVGHGSDAGYRIYHINSGLHAGRGFKQKNVAKAVAAIMAQKGDWSFTDAENGFTPETRLHGGDVSRAAQAEDWGKLFALAKPAPQHQLAMSRWISRIGIMRNLQRETA